MSKRCQFVFSGRLARAVDGEPREGNCTLALVTELQRLEPVAGGKLGVPLFGPATGFVCNYSPDNAVRFELAGEAVEVLSGAYRCGTVEMSFGGRKASPRTAATLVGLGDSP